MAIKHSFLPLDTFLRQRPYTAGRYENSSSRFDHASLEMDGPMYSFYRAIPLSKEKVTFKYTVTCSCGAKLALKLITCRN